MIVRERVVAERVVGRPYTKLVLDESTGRESFQTCELVEKTIEQEVP